MSQNHTKFENPFGNIFSIAFAQETDSVVSPTLPVDPNLKGPLFNTTTTGATVALVAKTGDKVNIDDIYEIDVRVDTLNDKIKLININITYDPQILSIDDTEYLDTVFTKDSKIDVNEETGKISIYGEIAEGAETLNGVVANLRFAPLNLGKSTLAISLQESEIQAENGDNILTTATSLDFEVVGENVVVETPTPTSSATPVVPKSGITDPGNTFGIIIGVVALLIGLWSATVANSKKKNLYD